MIRINNNYFYKDREYHLVKNYVYTGDGQDFGILRHKEYNMIIYQDKNNPKRGYRVYQNEKLHLTSYNHDEDAILIQQLLAYGKNVKLTEFPNGVITYKDRIIGQVIPYYDNSFQLKEILKRSDYSQINPYTLLLKAYAIIKELYDNGIIYYDIHGSNFLVYQDGVKLIDFEYNEVYFRNEISFCENLIHNMVNWFISMANSSIRYPFKPENILNSYFQINDFNSLYHELKTGESLTYKKC